MCKRSGFIFFMSVLGKYNSSLCCDTNEFKLSYDRAKTDCLSSVAIKTSSEEQHVVLKYWCSQPKVTGSH